MRGKLVHELKLLVRVRVSGWVRVMVEFGTSSAFRGCVRVRVLGYGYGVRGRKVKSRDCALASDFVRLRAVKLILTHVRDTQTMHFILILTSCIQNQFDFYLIY